MCAQKFMLVPYHNLSCLSCTVNFQATWGILKVIKDKEELILNVKIKFMRLS